MPAADSPPSSPIERNGVTKFINCRLVKGNSLVWGNLLVSSVTGTILEGQEVFYTRRLVPERTVDLGGRILSPGLIDVQFNGAYGFDFSTVNEEDPIAYAKGARRLNKELIKTGVTSYLPTITSQRPQVYHTALPFLGPTGHSRDPTAGSESLGAHVEGPFLSPAQHGCHSVNVLRTAPRGLSDLEECYGASNLTIPSPIQLITLAPELPGALQCIPELAAKGIIPSIGHSDASFEEASKGIEAGAKMITHLFNAMKPLHHRNPGIFGLLGTPSTPSASPKPYFGIISDGVHLHPTSVKIAWNTHPEGMILVSDAMKWMGMPDGIYDWTNDSHVIKKDYLLTLEETGKIAGSAISLVECVSNFLNWTGATIPEALKAVTETPAKMLGLEGRKGSLEPGADADLVVLDLQEAGGRQDFTVDQVWKVGEQVFERTN